MAKQVMIVLGSPRKNGNCAVLAEQAYAGVNACGARGELIFLSEMKMEPCNACDACQTGTEADCIIDDDLTAMLPRLRQVDALIIAGPVYWFTFSAQIKLFIDRAFYALNGPEGHALKGKPMGLIMTYGDADPFTSGAVNAFRTFQDIWKRLCRMSTETIYYVLNQQCPVRFLHKYQIDSPWHRRPPFFSSEMIGLLRTGASLPVKRAAGHLRSLLDLVFFTIYEMHSARFWSP